MEFLDDAVAIVGAACRMPGGIDDLPGLWAALAEGRDLVTEVPPDRFDAGLLVSERRRPGRIPSAAGGFLDDVAGFDADFFGISPREASRIDPQQRLLLEMAVEALDDAGCDRTRLAGSDTAVFVGVSGHDYADLQSAGLESLNAYTMAGGAATNTANRISYVMDWHGESQAVDTACSSALTAVHRACEYLRAGRSRLVLAGGVSVLISPFPFAGFSAAAMLSPTGRCRAFSAAADGYVRSEGGGVVLLKRLRDALAGGDRVHAVILATGANSDGRTTGLSVPNSAAQEALLRDTYARAGVGPDQLAYFEAHGTGTPSGDPIECSAIGHALARHRTTGPLPIGAVKSNVGHQEAASGMAGLLKALLVLRHRRIPRTLHAEPLSPHIPFKRWRLAPVVRERALASGAGHPVVGVNSFGFGGANAHVVLTAPPDRPEPATGEAPGERPVPLLVSGRTPAALAAAAGRLADRLAGSAPAALHDIAYTASRRRSPHEHRAVVLTGNPGEAERALRAVAADAALPTGAAAAAAVARGRTAFAFSGNGSQWAGMGADLMAAEPVFREAVMAADTALAPHLGWSVAAALTAVPPDATRLAAAEVGQPLLFAVQSGLVALLASHGITPSAVLGHSVGEIAAAHAAGALDLSSAALVVSARSRAQAATAGQGRMAAVGLPEREARKELAATLGRLEIAGVNSPRDVTLAGPERDLAALGRELSARGVFFRMLDIDYAYHTRAMDPIEEPLRSALVRLRPASPAVPFASTVTGNLLDGTQLDAGYWWRNVRAPVRFADAVETVLHEGCDILVEIGPHPVLAPYLRRLAEQCAEPTAVVTTGARGADGPARVRDAVAQLLACGAAADWDAAFPRPGRVVDLPGYPWQRERHWHGEPSWWFRQGGGGTRPSPHPLLGPRLPAADPVWSGPVDPGRTPWLADHTLDDAVVMPAAGYLEMAFAAAGQPGARQDGGAAPEPVEIQHLTISRAMVLPGGADAPEVRLQVSLAREDQSLRIASQEGATGDWREHARCRARRLLRPAPGPLDVPALRARLGQSHAPGALYERAAARGLRLGPAFQVLTELRHGDGEALAAFRGDHDTAGYRAHPALLDAALQTGACLAAEASPREALFLPAAIDAVRLWHDLPASGWVHARCRERGLLEASWDVTVTAEDGRVIAELEGCRMRRFARPAAAPQRLHTVLRAAPHPADAPLPPSPLPTPDALLDASAPARAALAAAHAALRPAEGRDLLRALQAHFAARAVAEILPCAPEVTLPALLNAGVLPGYARLARLLLSLAADQGLLTPTGGDGPEPGWRITAEPRPEAVARAGMRDGRGRAHPGVIALFARCGKHLADVLRGRMDPLEVLFAEPDRHLIEQFYSDTADCRFHHRTARELLSAAVRAWPADRPLRILELGGGTGGMTAELLDVLPPERTQYIFTDLSGAFLPRARSRFAAHDFLEYRTLDLERDPVAQGFPEGSFDLVVASNALHVATDLRKCLRHIARLLAEDGQLLAVEFHDPRLGAIAFGLLDGFWAYTDEALRSASPLLTAPGWSALLPQCGFADVRCAGEPGDPSGLAQSVLLARRPGAAAAAAARREVPPGPATHWIVAAEQPEGPLARALAAELGHGTGRGGGGEGPAVRVVVPGALGTDGPGLVPDGADRPHLVLLLDEDPAAAASPRAALEEAVGRLSALGALGSLSRFVAAPHPALTLVTRPCGALPAPEAASHVRDAAVWGAVRTFANEQPAVAMRRVSLERGHDPGQDARRLARELLSPTDEDEVVLTRGGRFAPRLVPLPAAVRVPDDARREPYALELREPGLTPQLPWVPARPAAPGPGEVLIDVRAAGLNYHDALLAAGLMPTGADAGTAAAHRLGLECAGVVAGTGPGVTGFAPGDRVFAFAAGSLASHLVVDARTVGHLPPGMDFASGATLPVVYFTVHHSLARLARLAPGETVLVHAGAGGVGLAVTELARLSGATVIATAGTPAKRGLLRLLGVEHVLDSRSLRFADEVRRLTGGRGVDVVVNSLAGEALTRSVELLRGGGRFIELGKKDVYAGSPLPMRLLRDNISLFVVDASRLAALDPDATAATFRATAGHVASGAYPPLPHQPYPAARLGQAMRALQHSRHLGKVVLDLTEPPPVERDARPGPLDPKATYLVAGGLSGLGAATARWLAERGARYLALLSRRGPATPGSAELVAGLRRLGARAELYAADVADPGALARVFASAEAAGRPVRGVVHSTMGVEDAPLTELTPDRVRAVLAPKFLGGLLLHELTRERPLDFFLAYSSIAADVGNLGQAAYTAGNLTLEALVRHRRRTDLPGLAVAWGALRDTGFAARDHRLTGRLERLGVLTMTSGEARATVEELLATGADTATAGHFDWDRLRQVLPAASAPRFAALVAGAGPRPADRPEDLRRRLAALPAGEATGVVADLLAEELAQVLQTPPDRIDRTRRLDQLGLDSLMAAELVVGARRRLGCDLPPLEIMNATGLTDLARRALGRLGLAQDAARS